MKINVRYVLLVFYILLLGSTVYLLGKNLGGNTDGAALIFQGIIIGVCVGGIIGIGGNFKYSKKFNKVFLWVINGFFGLALINAITFGELGLISFREVVLYIVLGSIDGILLARIIKKYRKENR